MKLLCVCFSQKHCLLKCKGAWLSNSLRHDKQNLEEYTLRLGSRVEPPHSESVAHQCQIHHQLSQSYTNDRREPSEQQKERQSSHERENIRSAHTESEEIFRSSEGEVNFGC